MTSNEQIHATCVALDGAGVLIRGPSGDGKSDLAVRLIDRGARLVADDRVELDLRDGALRARPPDNLAGLIEARGIGILQLPHLPDAPVALVVELVAPDRLERLPAPAFETLLGVTLPCVRLDAAAPSAVTKVRLALDLALGRILRGDD